MDDPFGLLEVASKPKEGNKKPFPKKIYLTVISVLVVFVLALLSLFIFQGQDISADTLTSSASIKITNLPNEIKTGQSVNFNLVFTNKGESFESSYVLVQGEGVNLSQTIKQAKNLTSSDPGYIRKMTEEEHLRFDKKGDTGIMNWIGEFKANDTKTLQLSAVVTSGSSVPAKIEAKLYKPKLNNYRCGFLNLGRCFTNVGDTQVAGSVFQIEPTDSGQIKLRAGFNFISLPYVFTSGSLSEFFSSLKTRWAYIFDPTTAGYLDLNASDNASKIKPGAAFWLYDKTGGDYDLPQMRVETNPNETYIIPLAIGWNQVGNPYSKKLKLSGEKIIVRELADDGSELGTAYNLKTAISNGILSDPYFIVYPTSGSTAISTVKALLESSVEPFSGFMIKATKRINLVFPGKEVITPGDNLSAEERAKIENWISESGLNQFGDSTGTVYAGGTPLFDEATGQNIDRFDYILSRHPDRPWNR